MIRWIKWPALLSAFFIVISGCTERKITLRYEGNAQFEIMDESGSRVLIDVYDPDKLSRPADAKDILLTTHRHWDHFNQEFVDSFPGTHYDRVGQWTVQALSICSVRASHSAIFKEPMYFDEEMLVFCLEFNGFRIVHMGDTAQLRLEKNQRKQIKHADIFITNLRHDPNSYFDPIGFGPIQQIKPRIIIPSHMDRHSGEYALDKWKGYRSAGSDVTIRRKDLARPIKLLFIGTNARELSSLVEWEKFSPGESINQKINSD